MITKDEGFLKLCNLHHEYDKRISYLNKRHLLSTEEEAEKKKIQKLNIKDQMDQILCQFKEKTTI